MFFFFFNDPATTEIYTLSLHDALPIWLGRVFEARRLAAVGPRRLGPTYTRPRTRRTIAVASPAISGGATRFTRSNGFAPVRSEEDKSENQLRQYIVCRLLLE